MSMFNKNIKKFIVPGFIIIILISIFVYLEYMGLFISMPVSVRIVEEQKIACFTHKVDNYLVPEFTTEFLSTKNILPFITIDSEKQKLVNQKHKELSSLDIVHYGYLFLFFDDTRFINGFVIDKNSYGKLDLIKDSFTTITIPESKILFAEFPFRNLGSFFFVKWKALPYIEKTAREQYGIYDDLKENGLFIIVLNEKKKVLQLLVYYDFIPREELLKKIISK